MSQLTYSESAEDAFAGMLGDSGDNDIFSRANGEGAAVEFGVAVTVGTDTFKQFELPDAGGDAILGVLAHRHTQDRALLSGTEGLKDKEDGDVLRKGRIWVRVEEAVAPGEAVYFRHTASGPNTFLGRFRNDADTATATLVANASWVKGSSGAGIALLDINLP